MNLISKDITAEDFVKIRIEAVGGDLDRVACRYPVSFMNEMARQLTPAIESATGVTGISSSSVELVMVFAPSTYMEHISGNVTYRRLMLVDAVSAPRDFWIKWTRLEAVTGEYNADNILFELGEDVEQNIRQREYKYLLSSGKEKYHNSMSRKKVTEWREVIKRAVRRGELSKIESDYELAPETLELEERIADLLGKKAAEHDEPTKAEVPYISEDQPESDEFARAMEKARMVVEGIDEEESVDDTEELILAEMTAEIDIEETEDDPLTLAESEPVDEPFILTDEPATETVVEFEDADGEAEGSEFDFEEEDEEEIPEESDDEIEEEDEPDELDIFADEEAEPGEADIFDEADEIVGEPVDDTVNQDAPVDEFIIMGAPTEEMLDEDEITESEISDELSVEEDEITEDDDINAEEIIEEEEFTVEIVEISAEPVEDVAEETESVCESSDAEEITDEPKDEPAPVPVTQPGIAERVADIRAELEIKIRLEYEIRAREKAEAELRELRQRLQKVHTDSELAIAELKNENGRLRLEYDRLLEQIESERFTREADEARRRIEEIELRAEIESQLRAEAAEREKLAEAARMALEEQHRLEVENARIARERAEEERAEAERARREEQERELEAKRIRREEHERELEALRNAELERIRREQEEAKARAKAAMPDMGDGNYSYTSKTVKFIFRRSVDPNITTRIQQLIKATVDYYGKDNVYLRIRATVPDNQTVLLEFLDIPLEEMPLLGNIIKVLGNSGLGIVKAIIE